MNAVIGLTKDDPEWPSVLAERGWTVEIVESKLLAHRPDERRPLAVEPDVVLCNEPDLAKLLCECKVGTVQQDQLQRGLALTLDDVREQHSHPTLVSAQYSYFATEPHAESCARSLEGTTVPLVSFDDDRCGLVRGEFESASLQDVFGRGFEHNGRPPTRYIPLDLDSPNSEFFREVAAALFQLSVRLTTQFDKGDIVRIIFDGMYEYLSGNHRRRLEDKVEGALNSLARPTVLGAVLQRRDAMWSFRTSGGPGGLSLEQVRARIERFLARHGDQEILL